MLLHGGPSGSGKERVAGWGPGLRGQPGVQELLVLLVGSCISVSTCVFLGSRSITSVSSSKGFMPPGVGRTFAEKLVKPAGVVHTGKASGMLCALKPVTSQLWRARRGWRSQLSTQAWSLLPQESGGPWPGGQAARTSSSPDMTPCRLGGSSHQGMEPAPNSGLHQPSLLSLRGTSRGRSS